MTTWVWIGAATLRAVHGEQLAEHGGPSGVRDENLFESAVVRPQQLAAHGDPDVADLAGALGWGLARNHPFIDGNKRTAFVATELLLECNGYSLVADDAACVLTILAVASGAMPEADFTVWIREHMRQI
jgi:death on curing protein